MALTSQQVADKWSARMAQSGDAFRAGVQSVTVNPAEKAARAQDSYLAGVQRAVSNGKWQAGLRRTTLESWRTAMIDKGANRLASGAAAAKPKFEQFMAQLLPHVAAGKAKMDSMPRGDLETNKARMLAWVDHMASFKRR